MDRPPPNKKEEELNPLLNVNSGGDAKVALPTAVVEPRWVTPGRWLDRLPEVFTTCWVVLILLGAILLVFYSIGFCVPKRHHYVVLNCNATAPPSYNVFIHEIVHQDMPLPIDIFADTVGELAARYPNLQFHLIFLTDSEHTSSHRKPRLVNRLYPMFFREEDNKKIQRFQNKYSNVNVTVSSLYKLLAASPLRYKMRYIPQQYLPFYVRALAVWAHGGVAMEPVLPDSRVHAILQQHNQGFREPDYADTIKSLMLDYKDGDNFVSLLYDMVKHSLNSSMLVPSFNGSSLQVLQPMPPQQMYDAPAGMNRRIKRNAESYSGVNMSITSDPKTPTPESSILNDTLVQTVTIGNTNNTTVVTSLKESEESVKNSTEEEVALPLNLLFVDVVITENVGPSYSLGEKGVKKGLGGAGGAGDARRRGCYGTVPYLTLLADGGFLAATARQHPLLTRLLTKPFVTVNPVDKLRDMYAIQCSGFQSRFDPFCKKIYV